VDGATKRAENKRPCDVILIPASSDGARAGDPCSTKCCGSTGVSNGENSRLPSNHLQVADVGGNIE
jgi:hypothetical protein